MDSDQVTLAVILGPHGVRGDARIKSFTEQPLDCFSYGELKSRDGKITLEAKRASETSKGILVTPLNPLQREEWQALKGTELGVPRSLLPKPEDDEFYIDDIVGLVVLGPDGDQPVGSVKAVHDFGAGDILEIALEGQKKTVMVPLTEEDVPEINADAGLVRVSTLELWSNDAEPEDIEGESSK